MTDWRINRPLKESHWRHSADHRSVSIWTASLIFRWRCRKAPSIHCRVLNRSRISVPARRRPSLHLLVHIAGHFCPFFFLFWAFIMIFFNYIFFFSSLKRVGSCACHIHSALHPAHNELLLFHPLARCHLFFLPSAKIVICSSPSRSLTGQTIELRNSWKNAFFCSR